MRPKATAALASVVKVAALAADAVRRPGRGVVILIYHRVGRRTDVAVDLPLDLFQRQMEWIGASGRATTLDTALALLAGSPPDRAPSEDPLVVTFDDGTADFVDLALPVLERLRIPATIYVATDFLERGVAFPHAGMPLSWSALKDAVATGLVGVGSHGHSHRLLDRLPAGDVKDDLARSIDLIGERLGLRAEHFAYPKAVPGSEAANSLVRQRFRSAALGGNRLNPFGATDPYRLWRSPLQVSDGMRWFTRKAQGGLALEDGLRALLNRRRYAGLTT